MVQKRGLGKGLDALIPATPEETLARADNVVMELDLDEIQPGPAQTRKHFENETITALARSIKEHGILQPIIVREVKGKGFEIVAGERRFRACQEAGLKKVSAIVKSMDDTETAIVSLIENIQRQDLNPIEEAKAYEQLTNKHYLTQEEVSRKAGKSRPFITNMLRLLTLPEEIQKMLENNQLTPGHARALLILDSPQEQLATADRIIKNKLSVRQTESLVQQITSARTNMAPPRQHAASKGYLGETEKWLKDILRAETKIKTMVSGGGKIEIRFENQDHLQKILEMFHVLHDGETGRQED